MCMEDVRIGRESFGSPSIVQTTGGTAVQICKADPNRTALTISGDGQGVIFVSPAGSGGSNSSGFTLTAANPILKLTLENVGSQLRNIWNAYDGGLPAAVFTISVSLGKQ